MKHVKQAARQGKSMLREAGCRNGIPVLKETHIIYRYNTLKFFSLFFEAEAADFVFSLGLSTNFMGFDW